MYYTYISQINLLKHHKVAYMYAFVYLYITEFTLVYAFNEATLTAINHLIDSIDYKNEQ